MRYTLNFLQQDHAALMEHLFADAAREQAAYLVCRAGTGGGETRLLVREVIAVEAEDIAHASDVHMSIRSRSYVRAMKKAAEDGGCFVFVHSHPTGIRTHSSQDDEEERTLFASAYSRIGTSGPHGSVVYSARGTSSGRVWLPDGHIAPIERSRVIGDRFAVEFGDTAAAEIPPYFERQVRAFGRDIQRLLARLTVGVVGAGGTGSAVGEELIRLGIGAVVVADGDYLDVSNVNRVYGSTAGDAGVEKVALLKRNAERIGLSTQVDAIARPITFESVMRALLQCDAIFGCTDDEWGRAVLTTAAVYYHLPVLDLGVKIDSEGGVLRSIQGRVSVLLPAYGCLYCNRRITTEAARQQVLETLSPDEAERRRAEGYAPEELHEPDPAVIPFTTAVAASAVTELLHRFTGFMGASRHTTEILHRFDEGRMGRVCRLPLDGCFCADRANWGRGDTPLFLNMTWRPE